MRQPVRQRTRGLMLGLLLLLISSGTVASTLKICSDVNFWYPFTMVEDGKAVGIHIDMIRQAVEQLGHQVTFLPMPWRRCLKEAELGSVDGIAVASYNTERAGYLRYPGLVDGGPDRELRVANVAYVVVTAADNDYEFEGDVHTIPQPVMAPRGWSIVTELRKAGVKVDDHASGDENNLRKLLRDGQGAIVTIPEVIRELGKQPAFKGHFKVSSEPVSSRDYYLPFSRKGQVDTSLAEALWQEIKSIRDDQALMASIAAKY